MAFKRYDSRDITKLGIAENTCKSAAGKHLYGGLTSAQWREAAQNASTEQSCVDAWLIAEALADLDEK